MDRRHPRRQGDRRESERQLRRRGQAQPHGEPQGQPGDGPQTTAGWWRAFEADLQAVKRAVARQHRAAIAAGEPWPPQHAPEPDPGTAPGRSPQSQPVPAHPEQDDQAARLGKLLAQADEAAWRVKAQRAEQQASSEYAVRMEQQAQAEPKPDGGPKPGTKWKWSCNDAGRDPRASRSVLLAAGRTGCEVLRQVPSLLGPLEHCHSAPATVRLAVASGVPALINGAEPRGGQGIGGHVSLPGRSSTRSRGRGHAATHDQL